MKLYDCGPAPSPRMVRIFLAEKGVEIPVEQVDLQNGAQFGDEFKQKNPLCDVPTLELDDGTHISQISAICAYLEERFPEPTLYGNTPEDRARTRMWEHAVFTTGFMAGAEGFRNSFPAFENRALVGPHNYAQIPALVERAKQRLTNFYADMDQRLNGRDFLVLEHISAADIVLLVTIDFVQRGLKFGIAEELTHLQRWYEHMSQRPSASA